MKLNIENETEIDLGIDHHEIITKVVHSSFEYLKCPYEAEVNVILTDNHEIKEINKEYRNIHKVTDVLSFPMVDYYVPENFELVEFNKEDYFNPENNLLILGDIVISLEKVKEQAMEYGHTVEREIGFLIAHSMLHLFGHDHMEEEERIVMESKQEDIMKLVGLTR